MNKGGYVFVGLTALMAAMDGALLATVGAVGIAAACYAVLCRKVHAPGETLMRQREADIRMLASHQKALIQSNLQKAVAQLDRSQPEGVWLAPEEIKEQRRILAEEAKEQRRRLEELVKSDLAELAKARELDKHGGREAIKWASIGIFACPPLALAVLAAQLKLKQRAQQST